MLVKMTPVDRVVLKRELRSGHHIMYNDFLSQRTWTKKKQKVVPKHAGFV
jgi:hypothetical protein